MRFPYSGSFGPVLQADELDGPPLSPPLASQ